MGKVKMPFYFKLTSKGMNSKLLAACISQMPEGTKFVGVENDGKQVNLLFENSLFNEGAEITGNFQRETAVVGNQIIQVDHFVGLDLGPALRRDDV